MDTKRNSTDVDRNLEPIPLERFLVEQQTGSAVPLTPEEIRVLRMIDWRGAELNYAAWMGMAIGACSAVRAQQKRANPEPRFTRRRTGECEIVRVRAWDERAKSDDFLREAAREDRAAALKRELEERRDALTTFLGDMLFNVCIEAEKAAKARAQRKAAARRPAGKAKGRRS